MTAPRLPLVWVLLIAGCTPKAFTPPASPDTCSRQNDCENDAIDAKWRLTQCDTNWVNRLATSGCVAAKQEADYYKKRRDDFIAAKRAEQESQYYAQLAEQQKRINEQRAAALAAAEQAQKAAAELAAKKQRDAEARVAAVQAMSYQQRVDELKGCYNENAGDCDDLAKLLATMPMTDHQIDKLLGLNRRLRGDQQMYLCGDGSASNSCVCGGSKRGCCSQHGGVAGCEQF